MTREISSCEEALQVLAEHLDDELDPGLRTQLLEHLDTCRSCYSRAEFERRLKAHLRSLGQEPVPVAVTERVHRLLQQFASSTTP